MYKNIQTGTSLMVQWLTSASSVRGFWGRMDIYMYGWVPSLFTWNYHNIVNRLYPDTKQKVKKKRLCLPMQGV